MNKRMKFHEIMESIIEEFEEDDDFLKNCLMRMKVNVFWKVY